LVKSVFENTTLDENKPISGQVKPIYSRIGMNYFIKIVLVFSFFKNEGFSHAKNRENTKKQIRNTERKIVCKNLRFLRQLKGFFLKNHSQSKYCAIGLLQDYVQASLVASIREFLNLS